MKITLRKAHISDATGIAAMHYASFKKGHEGLMEADFLNTLSKEEFIKRWEEKLAEQKELVCVAEDSQSNIIGMTSFLLKPEEQAAEGLRFYVHPDYWRQGIGKQLAKFILERIKATGFKTVYGWVLKTNPKSRAFYEALGASMVKAEERINEKLNGTPEIKYQLTL